MTKIEGTRISLAAQEYADELGRSFSTLVLLWSRQLARLRSEGSAVSKADVKRVSSVLHDGASFLPDVDKRLADAFDSLERDQENWPDERFTIPGLNTDAPTLPLYDRSFRGFHLEIDPESGRTVSSIAPHDDNLAGP